MIGGRMERAASTAQDQLDGFGPAARAIANLRKPSSRTTSSFGHLLIRGEGQLGEDLPWRVET